MPPPIWRPSKATAEEPFVGSRRRLRELADEIEANLVYDAHWVYIKKLDDPKVSMPDIIKQTKLIISKLREGETSGKPYLEQMNKVQTLEWTSKNVPKLWAEMRPEMERIVQD